MDVDAAAVAQETASTPTLAVALYIMCRGFGRRIVERGGALRRVCGKCANGGIFGKFSLFGAIFLSGGVNFLLVIRRWFCVSYLFVAKTRQFFLKKSC